MAMVKAFNRVYVQIATTGTGAVTFGTVIDNSFMTPVEAGGASGDRIRYCLEEGSDFEIGIGTLGSGALTMTRDTVEVSKIGGAAGVTKMTLGGTATLRIVASALDYGIDNLHIHGADIASAGTINLDTATGDLVDVTGTTAITAVTLAEGRERTVRFTGALTLTNGASLVLPGGANITTSAGDMAVFRGYAGGVVRCVSYGYIGAIPSARLSGAYTGITGLGTLTSLTIGAGSAITSSGPGGALVATAFSTDAANLTGTVASERLAGAYTGITGLGTLTELGVTGAAATITLNAGANRIILGDNGMPYIQGMAQAGANVGLQFYNFGGRVFYFDSNGVTHFENNTASTSTTTGALVVSGGVGVGGDGIFGGDISANGNIHIGNAADSQGNFYLNGGTSANVGPLIRILRGNVLKAFIGTQSGIQGGSSDNLCLYSVSGVISIYSSNFQPVIDNNANIGSASFRWNTVFAATGTINTSDERAKANITPLTGALALADKIDVVGFDLLDSNFESGKIKHGKKMHRTFGVKAQQVRAALPNHDGIIFGDETKELLGINESKIGILALAAVKELTQRVAALENRNR